VHEWQAIGRLGRQAAATSSNVLQKAAITKPLSNLESLYEKGH
jgi:hypothetical protein